MSNVEHPKHYNFSKIEVIDVIDKYFYDFYFGNIFKYITRAKMKNGLEDMKKSKFYLDRLYNTSFHEDLQVFEEKPVPQLITDFLDTDYFSDNHKNLIIKLFQLAESYYGSEKEKVINSVLYEEYNSLFELVLKELQK